MSRLGMQKLREMQRVAFERGDFRELQRIHRIARLKRIRLKESRGMAAF